MCPGVAMDNILNSGSTDAESRGYLALAHCVSQEANLSNLRFIELYARRGDSPRNSSAFDFVAQIVRVVSKIKMVIVNATANVATMKHVLENWNRSKLYFPAKSMGADHRTSLTTPRNLSVSLRDGICRPNPTRSELGAMRGNRPVFIDLFPKSLFERSAPAASNRTETVNVFYEIARRDVKFLATSLADCFHGRMSFDVHLKGATS
jgi:hypothetical protein